MKEEQRSAIVLLSGGLDSATTAAIAISESYRVHALSFRYGQRHALEVEAAQRVATHLGVYEHVVIDIDLRKFGGSALTADIPVPKARSLADIGNGIPVTYVPARNTIFLSFALAWAEVLGCGDIFLGINAVDYSGYPDCRPEYVEAFQRLANLSTKAGVEDRWALKIHAPLIDLTKAEIIRRGIDLGVDYALTLSCYDPSDLAEACGECDACILRAKAFHDNGLTDPAPYRQQVVLSAARSSQGQG